mgnify:FL=1
MLIGTIKEASRLVWAYPRLAEAVTFIQQTDLEALSPGEHAIDGRRLYVNAITGQGKGTDAPLEAHNLYADIHVCIRGLEVIGFSDRAACRMSRGGYDAQRDVEFFDDKPLEWNANPPGAMQVFYPSDAHAPQGGSGEIRKVVVKILL